MTLIQTDKRNPNSFLFCDSEATEHSIINVENGNKCPFMEVRRSAPRENRKSEVKVQFLQQSNTRRLFWKNKGFSLLNDTTVESWFPLIVFAPLALDNSSQNDILFITSFNSRIAGKIVTFRSNLIRFKWKQTMY